MKKFTDPDYTGTTDQSIPPTASIPEPAETPEENFLYRWRQAKFYPCRKSYSCCDCRKCIRSERPELFAKLVAAQRKVLAERARVAELEREAATAPTTHAQVSAAQWELMKTD